VRACVRAYVRASVKVTGVRLPRQRASGGERRDLARFESRGHHLITLFVVQLPRVSVSVCVRVCERGRAHACMCVHLS
jgi:hypothetical protein